DRCEFRTYTAMKKDRVIDPGDGRQTTYPLSVTALRGQCVTAFSEAGRPRWILRFSTTVRLLICECGVIIRCDVPEIAVQVHRLMISHEHDHFAALPGRGPLKRHQQVHDLASLRAAIEEIPDLHERGVSARPPQRRINQMRPLEN